MTPTGRPEGVANVEAVNPGFAQDSVLVSEYGKGTIRTYGIDSSGNPVFASSRPLLTGLSGAQGAAIDPLIGDFLFSTFGGGDRVLVISGFLAPAPEPAGIAVIALGIMGLAAVWQSPR